MKYIFLGGAGEVGASCLLIQVADRNILIDCGIRVNRTGEAAFPDFQRLNRLAPTLDAVFISHAHADHIGALPTLYKIYPGAPTVMTRPTADLATIMLGSAPQFSPQDEVLLNRIRERTTSEYGTLDALIEAKRGKVLLADRYKEIFSALEHISIADMDEWFDLGWGHNWAFRLIPSGHILGAVSIDLRTPEGRFLYKGGRTLPKHNQSKALGPLTDFSQRPEAPIEDPLEKRLRTLERAVNEILFQLADISERLDQPIRNQDFGKGTSKPTPPKQRKTSEKPKPKPPKPTPAPEAKMTEADVQALADAIFQYLSDGTPRPKKEILKAVDCQSSEYQKARLLLIETGRMLAGAANEIIPDKICNVPGGLAIWTQEQVDAELKKRELKVKASETEATDADGM